MDRSVVKILDGLPLSFNMELQDVQYPSNLHWQHSRVRRAAFRWGSCSFHRFFFYLTTSVLDSGKSLGKMLFSPGCLRYVSEVTTTSPSGGREKINALKKFNKSSGIKSRMMPYGKLAASLLSRRNATAGLTAVASILSINASRTDPDQPQANVIILTRHICPVKEDSFSTLGNLDQAQFQPRSLLSITAVSITALSRVLLARCYIFRNSLHPFRLRLGPCSFNVSQLHVLAASQQCQVSRSSWEWLHVSFNLQLT